MGVRVGSGVFSSMVGGWSPTTGGSAVGRVENIPGGGVGDSDVSASEPPQASNVKNATMTAALPRFTTDDFSIRFPLRFPQVPRIDSGPRLSSSSLPFCIEVNQLSPSARRISRISLLSSWTARWRAESPKAFVMLTLAPASTRTRTISSSPLRIAR